MASNVVLQNGREEIVVSKKWFDELYAVHARDGQTDSELIEHIAVSAAAYLRSCRIEFRFKRFRRSDEDARINRSRYPAFDFEQDCDVA